MADSSSPNGVSSHALVDASLGSMLAVPGPPRFAPPARTPRPVDIVYALRRRWGWALGLGLLAAATAAAIAWFSIPVSFTATALLRISERKPQLMFDTTTADSLLSARRGQATLITSNFVLNAALKPEMAALDSIRSEKDQIAWLRRHLEVTFPGGSDFLQIAVTCEKAEDAVALTKAVKDAYMKEVVTVERLKTVRHKETLSNTYQANLRTIQRQSEHYRKLANELQASDSEFVRQKETHTLQSLSDLRTQVIRLRGQIQGLERKETILKARLQAIHPEGEGTESSSQAMLDRLAEGAVRQDPTILQMANRLQLLEQAKIEQSLVARGGEKSPAVQRLQEQITLLEAERRQRSEELLPQLRETIKQQMAQGLATAPRSEGESLQASVEAAQLEKAVLQEELQVASESFDRAAREADRLGTYSTDLEQQRSELDRLKKINDRIGTVLQQYEIELAADLDRVTALEEPALPKSSNLEKKQRQVLLVAVVAFGLAVLGVVSLDFVGYRVSSAEELNLGLGVRVIGDLPRLDPPRYGNTKANELQGLVVESVDNIRTSLLHRAQTEGIHTVMVTSALPQEGKTTVCCQLAASLARSGRRTVLVDGDLRRPSAHRPFELPVGPGVAELLRGEAVLDEVIRPTRAAGLWMIPAGKADFEASQAIAQGRLVPLLERLRQEFDFVLVDSGPVLADPDALLVGESVDGVLLCVRRDVSRMPLVSRACERLRTVDLPILGAVMNGVSVHHYRPYYRPYAIEAEAASV